MSEIAKTPVPPYYAVIFSSVRTEGDKGYADMASQMVELAEQQDGYLGIESARDSLGITVSYWRDLDSIKSWKQNCAHQAAQIAGKELWYNDYRVRISKVERDYGIN